MDLIEKGYWHTQYVVGISKYEFKIFRVVS
jgi:hypothetical protein